MAIGVAALAVLAGSRVLAVILGLFAIAFARLAVAAILLALALGRLLLLLLRGVHRAQDAKVMFRMLEVAFGRHTVATAGRITSQLEILLEQLLGCATKTDVGPARVEDVVAIEGLIAVSTATTATATASVAIRSTAATATTTAMTMATAHALHVHSLLCFAVLMPRRSRLRASCRLSAPPSLVIPGVLGAHLPA